MSDASERGRPGHRSLAPCFSRELAEMGREMVDLTAKPFSLDAGAVAWVRRTIEAMTLEEKLGQLFVNLNGALAPAYLDRILDRYHVGGMRFRPADAATVQAHLRHAQARSKVPLLVAANPAGAPKLTMNVPLSVGQRVQLR